MSGNPVRRTGLVLISWLLIFAEVITFAGCTSKTKGKVKKVAGDSTWFDSTETRIYGKYKGRKFNLFNQEILGAYKEGVLIRTEVVVDYSRRLDEPGNSEDVIEYYSFTGELIKSVDARELLFNRSIDDIIIGDTDVVFRMHDTVGAADRNEEKCYLVSIDPEAGTVGELKEIESIPVDNTNDFDSDNYRSYDGTWIIGEYSVSRYSTNVLNTLMITKNGKSRFVDITGDPHFTGVRFNDYIVVSETEILLVCKYNSVDFISVNLETGEVKNKDEEYSWLKKISVEGRLSSFGEKTYFKDAYGLKRINFESKKLEEVFSFNCCNANRNDLSSAELISVKDDRYVFARKVTEQLRQTTTIQTQQSPAAMTMRGRKFSSKEQRREGGLFIQYIKQFIWQINREIAELGKVIGIDGHYTVALPSNSTLVLQHILKVFHLMAQGCTQLAAIHSIRFSIILST